MSDIPVITMWRGKDIETLSRDELLDAVRCQGRELHDQQQLHLRNRDQMRIIREAKAKADDHDRRMKYASG